ncbi:paraquat-inducible membrane protein A [Donghicola sp. C2-DW-16]|uniref:Paraquat-inducible membrane protein A n=1 Tax=Donghicola mangrovi TaxID=2729614 RepID=A0ABX2PBZ5_9RHOB|nr:paraquat-inducible protein A [Donghicola mangrovi]NVO26898.1 paraquat-inducible membrane protein A [Donghicola mangrovi]
MSDHPDIRSARDCGLLACTRCGAVWSMQDEGAKCDRCGHVLQSRDTKSLQRVWAWWVAALMAYIPSNLEPMLRTRTLVAETESTIVEGAFELIHHGDIPVALIILIASVGIPVAKFGAIAYLALSVNRQARMSAHRRQHLYELVEYIGRWSMIDVFVVAILSALVQLNVAAQISPGPAALTFALSVIFTMLSAQSFDSRMIWDSDTAPDAPVTKETHRE